jgi:hypothetical protein
VPLADTAGPSSQSAFVGQSVDFSAGVSGLFSYYFPNSNGTAYNLLSIPPTTFQWYKNGAAVPGATNLEFSITNVQTSNAGTYTFVVNNSISPPVTNSPPAVLTVSPFTANSDLVGWWRFNDGSGTTAADSSGYNDPGTLDNFPTSPSPWVTGLDNQGALNYANADTNGDNVVVVPDAPQLNFTNNLAFTLAVWINSATNSQASAALIAKGFGNGGEEYDLDLFTGYLRFFVRNSAGVVSVINATNTFPPSNQWTHVAATFDGNEGYMALYLNAQLVGSNTTAPASLLYSTNPVTIGNRTSSSTNTYDLPFLGEMQDTRIYDVALGQQDIQAIYNVLAVTTPVTVQYASTAITGELSAPVLHFTGHAGGTYHVWTTTNLALQPVETTWTLLGTGTFSGGQDTFTCPAGSSTQFYAITQP